MAETETRLTDEQLAERARQMAQQVHEANLRVLYGEEVPVGSTIRHMDHVGTGKRSPRRSIPEQG